MMSFMDFLIKILYLVSCKILLGRAFQLLLSSINYSVFSITSSIFPMVVLFLYSRDSVLVSYENFGRAVPVVPLSTEQYKFPSITANMSKYYYHKIHCI